jgi:hypothetical protein
MLRKLAKPARTVILDHQAYWLVLPDAAISDETDVIVPISGGR